MDSNYQTNKMKEILKRGVSMLILMHLCLNVETVFAVPSDIKQRAVLRNKLLSEKERFSTSKTPQPDLQTKFLPELNDVQDKLGKSSYSGIFSIKTVVSDANVIPKTSIRHAKHKLRKERKNIRNATKRKENKKSRRKSKDQRSLGLEQKSCPTRTSHVFKRTAEDIFGNTVDVYPVINIGKLAIDQYFYESFCDVEKCECAGVNNKKFESSCQTTHSYTYARVVKSGEIGWSYIKVRSGCSCVIQEKRKNSLSTITDLLL